jgi:hypothetical protein
MKNIIISLLISSFGISFFSAFAADTNPAPVASSSKADHFEVSIKTPVRI